MMAMLFTSMVAVDPASDMETINTELALADLQTIEKAIPRLEKEARVAKGEGASA